MNARTCSIEGCERRLTSKGRRHCEGHYRRLRDYGDPTKGAPIRDKRGNGQLRAELRAAAQAETDDCIILTGFKDRPRVRFQGKTMKASRVVWIIKHGKDPGELHVLHTCHRGDDGCINRRHLYLGDHARNMKDMAEAGRAAKDKPRLTKDEVRQIRAIYAVGGITQQELALRHGVTPLTISRIINGRTWSAAKEAS